MYAWIFRHLPGPTWLKVIESVVIVGAIVYALLTWGFPWVQDYFGLSESTVS